MNESAPSQRPLKIVVVAACPFPFDRGTPIRIFQLSCALADRGHAVHVVTYHIGIDPGVTPLRIHRIRNVITYRKTSAGPTAQKLLVIDPLLSRKIQSVVAEHEPDVIHAHHVEGLLAAGRAVRHSRCPLVFDVHTLLESELPFYGNRLTAPVKRKVGRWLDGRLPRRADHLIAVSQKIRLKLVGDHGCDPGSVSVIPNGVEIDHFEVAQAPASARRSGCPTLVFAGNLSAYQGIDLLLEAFAFVRARRPDVRLRLITNDSFNPFEGIARSRQLVDHIDLVRSDFSELPRHLSSADIAINPRAVCDGLPQKLLNYMAAGKPIVSFAGSARMLHHGETGWVVPGQSAEDLADGILHLLKQPALAQRLGQAAMNCAKRELSWDRAAQQTERVYAQLRP